MSYEATATRKRPQAFGQLAGQEFVAATLEASLATGRVAHAYLFSGPRGCGKTSTARILAKALNCEKGLGANPCGVCDSCRAITAGSSLDVIEIDGASNTSVENVRQIKDEVLFPPNSSRYKIYIIDEVHMLSTSAFNALLKTIEEPPPYVVFMFATTEPHKVPATIKSRCQQFTFRLVSSDIVKGLLAEACADLGVEAEDEALLWIARESGGSVRDAYTLLDQVVSFAQGNISAALIREKLGLVGQERMNALFADFISGDSAASLAALDSILSGGVSVEQFIADSTEYCRAMLMLKHGITRESILGAPLSSFDQGVAGALAPEKIEQLLSIFLSAYRNLKESVDPRFELELAVAKASHITAYVSPSDLARAVSALRRYVEGNAAPLARARPGQGQPQAGSAAGRPAVNSPDRASGTVSAAPGKDGAPRQSEGPQEVNPDNRNGASAAAGQAGAAHPPGQAAAPNRPDLPALKKAIIGDIRRSNALLAATMEKTRPWLLEGETIVIIANTSMENDHVKRFLGIVAELVAARLGAPRKLEVRLADDGQDPPPGYAAEDPACQSLPAAVQSGQSGSSLPASGPSGIRGGLAGSAAAVFNDHPGAVRGAADSPASRPSAPGPAMRERLARDPSARETAPLQERPSPEGTGGAMNGMTREERDNIAMVERCFKGNFAGIEQPRNSPAPAGTEIPGRLFGGKGGRTAPEAAEDGFPSGDEGEI